MKVQWGVFGFDSPFVGPLCHASAFCCRNMHWWVMCKKNLGCICIVNECAFCSMIVHAYDFVATLGFALKSCYHFYPLLSSCIHLLLCVPQVFVQIWSGLYFSWGMIPRLESLDFLHVLLCTFLLGLAMGVSLTAALMKCSASLWPAVGPSSLPMKSPSSPEQPQLSQRKPEKIPKQIYLCRTGRCYHLFASCQKDMRTLDICYKCFQKMEKHG